MKYTKTLTKTQAFSQEIPISKAQLQLLCAKANQSQNKLLNTLVYYSNRHMNVYPSVVHLAIRCGVTVQTIRRWLREFESLGILETHYRPSVTSVYRLHGILFTQTMRTALAHWIPSLLVQAFLPLSLLMVNCQVELSSPSIKRGIFIKSMHMSLTQERETYSNSKSMHALAMHKVEPVTCARTREEAKKNKEIDMKSFKRARWNMHMSKMVGLNLTSYGAVELSQFPDEIVEAVGALIESSRKDFQNPYAYAIKQCMQLCNQEQIIPDRKGVLEKWEALKWPARFSTPKYDEENPYINPPKSLNRKSETGSRYQEFTGHTMPKDYPYKVMRDYTSQDLEQGKESVMNSEQFKKNIAALGPEMQQYLMDIMDRSIQQRKEMEIDEHRHQAERIKNEAQQMTIE